MDCRVREDQASPAEQHSVEALDQRAVQGRLRGQDANVLDAEVNRTLLPSADDIGRVRELDLENQIELRR